MDLDAYSHAHGPKWDRLTQLGGMRRLDGREADELIDLYQSGATELSTMTSTMGRSIPADRLSLAMSRARLKFTGTPANPLRQIAIFFTASLPAALYRVRWITFWVTVACVAIGVAYGVWLGSDPRNLVAVVGQSNIEAYPQQFVDYYSNRSEAAFSGQVWTNNAFIAAQCIAFGILGVWAPYALLQNSQNVGVSGAIMAHEGRLDDFFLYIAPHGQLELYSIFLAGATGILIFWAWVAPGHRTRAQALREDGRALFTLVIGTTLMLLTSGLIEGIVTRQDWPWPIKIGIGTVALLAWLFYQWVVGRRAFRAGQTGDLERFEAGEEKLVAG
ncbi:stage II sporulation protein M [Schumannella luteola]|uniref:Putative membrane protein SpoIIM required for sporulation n=1 Tax=Schumannella luteola TaxID=472059 RepID=A0A852YI41_9MICO|nr:stage II sporulation protein M [Schumannella luteola]NYG98758.1 putative membrane protein SpoIIM required for sporulation [Schumannella luteola]TPX04442.1 stage II sporulation protein M [Schumannella luteola]